MKPIPNSYIEAMLAYTPGEQPQGQGWVKLNTNENPYAPSPAVVAAVVSAVSGDGAALRLYPSPDSRGFREAVGALHGLPIDHVLAGNGSDDVLNLLIRAYAGPGRPVGMLNPSYSLYPVLAAAQNAPVVRVEIQPDFTFAVDAVTGSGASIFFITNPNAPLGINFARKIIAQVAANFAGLLVVDEAYAAFAPEDCVELVRSHANVVITRTLSKAHALAGMRIGYVLARPEVIALLDRVRDSYNLDRVAQAAGVAALNDANWLQETVGKVKHSRERLTQSLLNLGWSVVPSATNFVLVTPVRPGFPPSLSTSEHAFDFLRSQKILVRRFPAHPLTASALRITVGTDVEVDAFLHVAKEWTAGRG
jgi:histidinol-phosphate aminotransferase